MSDYLKASEVNSFLFPSNFKQIWHHPFNRQGLRVDYVYIKNMTGEHGLKTFDEQIATLKFLYKHKCATFKQIKMYLELKGLDPSKTGKILQDFVFNRACNCFTLGNNLLEEFPDDAFRVYTLDFGGKTILSHFGENDVVEWLSSDTMYSPDIVSKYLVSNQFFLEILKNKGKDVEYYNPTQLLFVGNHRMKVLGEFSLKKDGVSKTFLLDVFREGDYPAYVRQRAEMFEDFFYGADGKNLHRYYDDPPIIIVISESENLTLDVAKIFYKICPAFPVRYITDDFTKEGITDTSFFKFKEDDNAIQRVQTSFFT